MNIDIHNHIIPEAYVEAVRSDPEAMGASLDGEFIRLNWGHTQTVGAQRTDLKRRIQMLDDARIDLATISMQVWLTGYRHPSDIGRRTTKVINDALEDIAMRYGGRFMAMGNVPLQDVDASIGELEKRRFPCFQILSNVNGRNLDEPSW
jgi:aminocarboxymuconate-semialdehyde decarboxylase